MNYESWQLRLSEKCHSRLDRESRISKKWLRYWIPAFVGMTKTHDFGVFGQSVTIIHDS